MRKGLNRFLRGAMILLPPWMMTSGVGSEARAQGGDAEAWKALKAAGLRFVVLNFEDARLRGTEGLEEKPFLNKVYSVEYFSGCPFPFLPPLWGLACGWNKAEVLEAGE